MSERVLDNTSAATTAAATPDFQCYGNGDLAKLVSKRSSAKRQFMQSIKFIKTGAASGVLQVSTQQKRSDGTYALSEALTALEDTVLSEDGRLVHPTRPARKRARCGGRPAPPDGEADDLKTFGDQSLFVTLSSAASHSQGFEKSTAFMPTSEDGAGVVLVTTRQRNDDGTWALATALTPVKEGGALLLPEHCAR